MNRELITGHFRMHFYVFSLWSSPLPCFQGMWFYTRVFLMFENYTPPWLYQHLEALSVRIHTRLSGNPCFKCIVIVSLCWTRQRTPSFYFRWSRTGFRARSGQVLWKETTGFLLSSFYCPGLPAKPSFSISHRGLSNPQHLSHFTTPMVESWLVWQAHHSTGAGFRNCFQTSQSAVICNFVHLLVQFICLQFSSTNRRCVCISARLFMRTKHTQN